MAERADLLGAIRLPAGTFRAAAGTDVVCDILVLSSGSLVQRFEVESWMSLAPVVTVDGEVVVNEYFATHPEMILGELRRVNGQYGEHDIDVIADPGKTIEAAITMLVAGAVERGLTYQSGAAPELAITVAVGRASALSDQPAAGPAAARHLASTSEPAGQLVRAQDTGAPDIEQSTVRKEGSIVTTGVATFSQVRGGELEPFQANRRAAPLSCGLSVGCGTPWPTCWRSKRAPPTMVRSVPPRCS